MDRCLFQSFFFLRSAPHMERRQNPTWGRARRHQEKSIVELSRTPLPRACAPGKGVGTIAFHVGRCHVRLRWRAARSRCLLTRQCVRRRRFDPLHSNGVGKDDRSLSLVDDSLAPAHIHLGEHELRATAPLRMLRSATSPLTRFLEVPSALGAFLGAANRVRNWVVEQGAKTLAV